MMLACVSTALLLLPTSALPVTRSGALAHQAPAAAAAAAAAPAPVDPNSKEGHAAQASDYYARGRFVEASLEFEGLWRDTGEPRFLFNAAASRYAAGHYAHTVKYLGEYLARSEVQGDDRKEAQVQLDEARKKVTTVQLSVVVPPGAEDEVKISVRHVARGASDLRPPLDFTARPSANTAAVPVQLEPGKWIVRAEAPGLTPAEQEIEVTPTGRQSAQLRLDAAPVTAPGDVSTPATETGVPPALARKLEIGLAASGGVVAATGIGVMIAGVVGRSQVKTCDAAEIAACKRELKLGLRTRGAGAGVLGAGLGVLAGGLVWASGDAPLRRKLWIGGAAIGGVALVGGYVGLLLSSRPFNRANTMPLEGTWEQHYSGVGKAGGHSATSAVLGLGAGLLASSITGLVVQSRFKKPRSAALRSLKFDGAASPWLTGVVVSGRF